VAERKFLDLFSEVFFRVDKKKKGGGTYPLTSCMRKSQQDFPSLLVVSGNVSNSINSKIKIKFMRREREAATDWLENQAQMIQ
jgi:hypothetical protein